MTECKEGKELLKKYRDAEEDLFWFDWGSRIEAAIKNRDEAKEAWIRHVKVCEICGAMEAKK